MKLLLTIGLLTWVLLIGCQEKDFIEPELTYDHIMFTTESDLKFKYTRAIDLSVYYKSATQDQLGLVMADSSSVDYCGIYLLDTDILNRSLPAKFNNETGSIFDGMATMSWSRLDNGSWIEFSNYTKNGLSVTVLSIEDKTVRGEFSGLLVLPTGEEIRIKSGKFKVTFRYN